MDIAKGVNRSAKMPTVVHKRVGRAAVPKPIIIIDAFISQENKVGKTDNVRLLSGTQLKSVLAFPSGRLQCFLLILVGGHGR